MNYALFSGRLSMFIAPELDKTVYKRLLQSTSCGCEFSRLLALEMLF